MIVTDLYKYKSKEWTMEWNKIKGIYNKTTSVCQSLQFAVKQYNQDSISMSFISQNADISAQNIDQLESSFMYTQILKEILLEMEYETLSVKDFIIDWRKTCNNNPVQLNTITEFEDEYRPETSIWWCTREYFIYNTLNRALRTLESNTIINMSLFIRDLHHQLEHLQKQQTHYYNEHSFTVYRGQGLSEMDFQRLLKNSGGLISFNNFLSTSLNREVSLLFAESASAQNDITGILFEMSVNSSVLSVPFASIQDVSYFQTEKEVLFSMHTIFRTGNIKKINNNNRLYQVELQLTSEDDKQLRALTDYIRAGTNGNGWERLGRLLIKICEFRKAEQIYRILLEETSDENIRGFYFHQLGYIKNQENDYASAVQYYEKSHEIWNRILPQDHPSLATYYNNIGLVYKNKGEYSKALSFYEKDLEISQKNLPSNRQSLAICYSNIGSLYKHMEQYSKALLSYEKALELWKENLPSNHPSLAVCYNNIGSVYKDMKEYSKALLFYNQALEILEKVLPSNHPDLATSYNNIGLIYVNIGEHYKSLKFYEKALEIRQKTLPSYHSSLATSYNNIGLVYCNMAQYEKALPFFEKTIEIRRNIFPSNHPDLIVSYSNIGFVYYNIVEFSKALSFYERALKIQQKTLPSCHLSLGTSYNNIALIYNKMGEYSKALSCYEQTLEIQQKILPLNHPDLALSYSNMGSIYDNMGEYSKAIFYYKKSSKSIKVFYQLIIHH